MKKKILFIGHSFHKKTKSSDFLKKILEEKYNLTELFFNPENGVKEKLPESVLCENYDILICFQVCPSPKEFKKINFGRIAYFPMYDGSYRWGIEKWLPFRKAIIICFSKALHKKLLAWGFDSHYFQYFPKPKHTKNWGNAESCFLWQRREEITCQTVLKTLSKKINHIHLHIATDHSKNIKKPENHSDIVISTSEWFPNKKELTNKIEESGYYMAPRMREGIGMSFLEAMAMGRCVVAPDFPTMNEYITHGETGLLYDPENPSIIENTSELATIQKQTLTYIEEGYKKWLISQEKILALIEKEAQSSLAYMLPHCLIRILSNPLKIFSIFGKLCFFE